MVTTSPIRSASLFIGIWSVTTTAVLMDRNRDICRGVNPSTTLKNSGNIGVKNIIATRDERDKMMKNKRVLLLIFNLISLFFSVFTVWRVSGTNEDTM